jgi:hypothetical protein
VSLPRIPAFYVASAYVCTLFAAGFIVKSRLPVPFRPLFALALVLVPIDAEVFLNLTNVQWILAPLLLILAIQDNPASTGSACFDLCLFVVLGLTGPFVPMLLPIFLLRPMLFGSSFYNWLMSCLAILVTLLQIAILTGSERLLAGTAEPRQFAWIAEMFFRRFVPHLFLGQQIWTTAGLLLFVAVSFAAVRQWMGSSTGLRTREAIIFAAASLMVVATLCMAENPHLFHAFAHGQRYFYIPYVSVSWFFLLGLGSSQPNVRRNAALISAMIAVSAITHLYSQPLANLNWSGHAQMVLAGKTTTIPLNPGPAWSIVVRPRAQGTLPQGSASAADERR